MSRMTADVEAELDRKMETINIRTGVVSDRLDRLSPRLDRIGNGLNGLEDIISGDLALALQVYPTHTASPRTS